MPSTSRRSPHDSVTFLLPGVANLFEEIGLCAAVLDGPWAPSGRQGLWYAFHVQPSMPDFEMEHGLERERDRYNRRCMAEARRTRRIVQKNHAGFSDRFVPVVVGKEVPAVLAAGPFLTSRPTSADILQRWHKITGRHGDMGDPEFSYYVSMTLSTLVLEGRLLASFDGYLEVLASLLAGAGRRTDFERALALRAKLVVARQVERAWGAAHAMIDERTAQGWWSPHNRWPLAQLGLSGPADRAMVGLCVARSDEDPLDARLRRDAFQRACVALARSAGDVIAGQVGDHGVVFLLRSRGDGRRDRRRMLYLAGEARTLARRIGGCTLHAGLSSLAGSASLPDKYQSALSAAEAAVANRTDAVESVVESRSARLPLRELRGNLGRLVEDRPSDLPARFERYCEAVVRHCSYQVEASRAHFEAGVEHIAGALLDSGVLSEKAYGEVSEALVKAAREARNLTEIAAAYRRGIVDLTEAARQPVEASRHRGLRRATAYIERHASEPLRRVEVAKIAGFAPNYFSELFGRQQNKGFRQYVRDVRIERAKMLLTGTDLPLRRVAELSGFANRFYFGNVFKRTVKRTPLEWRKTGVARRSR
jgi:AraC-like DNA-binding protein